MTHSRFVNDDGLQIQRAIQSLRLETQEALAESREEIARLEEENEIKQMRIEEIDAELDDLKIEDSFGGMTGMRKVEPAQGRGRARRRWSLASLGASFLHDGNEETDVQEPLKRRSKSVDEDGCDSDGEEYPKGPDRFVRVAKKMKDRSLRQQYIALTSPEAQVATEAMLIQRLHEVEEENKLLIHQQETNLKFKEEQVVALQLAYEEQGKIIDDLEDEIDHAREEGKKIDRESVGKHDAEEFEEKMLNDESSAQFDPEDLQDELIRLNDKENEISSQIRRINKILNMDLTERKSVTHSLKKDIVESAIRLKSIKHAFEAQQDVLRQSLSTKESEWALLKIELTLMETVSQKQIGRLEQMDLRGESADFTQLIEPVDQALQKELAMRECSDEITRKVLHLETLNLEKLVVGMLDCCDTFADSVQRLKSKTISGPIGARISDIIRQMEKGISIAENTVSLALFVLEETNNAYKQDDSLLPDVVQAAYFSPDRVADVVAGEELEASSSVVSVEGVDFSILQNKNDEIDERLREARQRLFDKRELSKSSKRSQSKIEELVSTYEQGSAQWDLKDEEFERAMQDAEHAKVAEDRLRAFLERTVRARISLDGVDERARRMA